MFFKMIFYLLVMSYLLKYSLSISLDVITLMLAFPKMSLVLPRQNCQPAAGRVCQIKCIQRTNMQPAKRQQRPGGVAPMRHGKEPTVFYIA